MTAETTPPDHAAALTAAISLLVQHLESLTALTPAVKACLTAGDSRRAFKLALSAETDLHDSVRMLEAAAHFKRHAED